MTGNKARSCGATEPEVATAGGLPVSAADGQWGTFPGRPGARASSPSGPWPPCGPRDRRTGAG